MPIWGFARPKKKKGRAAHPIVGFTLSFRIAYQGKDSVFRFIMEYSNLTEFGP
jgi:hypothetical protein